MPCRVLNRTLILPRFWSWCEMDQVATVLETCTKDGADQQLPFQTPSDYLLNMYNLPRSPFQTKEYSFLDNPRVRPSQALSSSPVSNDIRFQMPVERAQVGLTMTGSGVDC